MKKLIGITLVLAVAVAITGCGGSKYLNGDRTVADTMDTSDRNGSFIEVIGLGSPARDAIDDTQKKATSRSAAIVDAQYQLVAKIKGVKLEGGNTIEKNMLTDSTISAKVNDMINNADVVKTEWTKDDGCVLTMRIDKDKIQQQLNVKIAQ